nr:hypothetical protein CFP56_35730 [Quercus suber]
MGFASWGMDRTMAISHPNKRTSGKKLGHRVLLKCFSFQGVGDIEIHGTNLAKAGKGDVRSSNLGRPDYL